MQLEQAWELITEARELVNGALSDTEHELNNDAYGCCGLDQALGNGNPYDNSIPKWIDALNAEETV